MDAVRNNEAHTPYFNMINEDEYNAFMEDYKKNKYEMVNHPHHYNNGSVETIEKMRRIYGDTAVQLWCDMTAFKYRDRLGNKPDNSVEQELGKIKWNEKKRDEMSELNDHITIDDIIKTLKTVQKS